jgi:hypothetical protein
MNKTEFILSVLLPEYEKAIVIPFSSRHDALVAWSQMKAVMTKAVGELHTEEYKIDGIINIMTHKSKETLK